jgi:DNA invertase Pin-like site-specific DNA recombinase
MYRRTPKYSVLKEALFPLRHGPAGRVVYYRIDRRGRLTKAADIDRALTY